MRRTVSIPARLGAAIFTTLVLGSFPLLELKAAPGTGTLFGTDASGGNLITVDQVTGAGTVVGFMGAQ